MVDGDVTTMWHESDKDNYYHPKGVTAQFHKPQLFSGAVITRRPPPQDRYLGMCLIVDDNENEKVCTSGVYGEPFLDGEDIVLEVTPRMASKVRFKIIIPSLILYIR